MDDVKISSIRPASLAIFEATLGVVLGLALAVIVFFQATALGVAATDSFTQGLLFGLGTSAVILIAVPILYGVIGWVLGYVHGLIYNLIAQRTGGLILGIRPVEEPVNEPQPEEQVPQGTREAVTFGERIPERRQSKRRR